MQHLRLSKQNGLITLTGSEGEWEVWVNGTKQTSKRYGDMWANVFTHCAPRLDVPNVRHTLMLGLAGGGMLKSIYAAFPNTSIVAVEYDPDMAAIAEELALYKPYAAPTVELLDAREAVEKYKKEKRQFDLVIIDIFYGAEPSPLVADAAFMKSIHDILSTSGVAVINVCQRKEAFGTIQKEFAQGETWRYDLNYFGAFWS